MRRVILFDLDDTLISEDQYIRSGYRAVGKYLRDKFKISSGGDKRLYELYEEDSGYVFNRYLEELKIDYDKELILELVRVYREHKPDIDFFPDVIPALNRLKDMGAKMGIISDGYTITQRRKLEALKDKLYFFDKI
ncbi:MAG: HAD family hydrolase, partial [Lachnospiraceae bacterium]|nr:HAD family hydrolase [Lachnospiraceae bacterium]